MTVKERYEAAKEIYRAVGVDTDAALEALKNIPVSMHCWQGDDVIGFDGAGALSGGIQATGNYPGRARTPEELMADMDEALSLIPGTHRINLHASYAVFEEGEWADRDKLEPKHLQNGWNLQRKGASESTLTRPYSPTRRRKMPHYPVKF